MKASRQEKKDAMHSLRSFHGLPLQHIHAIQNLNEAVEDTVEVPEDDHAHLCA